MEKTEHEPTMAEMVEQLLRNENHRYVLIGSIDRAREGSASIFDTIGQSWIRITSQDGADQLHRDIVVKMLIGGARVEPKAPPA